MRRLAAANSGSICKKNRGFGIFPGPFFYLGSGLINLVTFSLEREAKGKEIGADKGGALNKPD